MSKPRKDSNRSIRATGNLRKTEIDLMIRLGSQITTDSYVMSPAVARTEIDRRRREIATLERLGRARLAYRLDGGRS